MKKLFDFLKGLFKGLFDILIVAAELLLCAIIVFFLIKNPIASPILKKEVPIDRGSSRALSVPTPVPTPTPGPLVLPDVDWVPATWGPEKYWGYDDKYSSTQLRRLPGYWKIASGPRPPIEWSWWSPVVYYEVWNIPSLFVETF